MSRGRLIAGFVFALIPLAVFRRNAVVGFVPVLIILSCGLYALVGSGGRAGFGRFLFGAFIATGVAEFLITLAATMWAAEQKDDSWAFLLPLLIGMAFTDLILALLASYFLVSAAATWNTGESPGRRPRIRG